MQQYLTEDQAVGDIAAEITASGDVVALLDVLVRISSRPTRPPRRLDLELYRFPALPLMRRA